MTDAWEEYLAAARRLDAVRRGAATAAGEQAKAVQAARDDLSAVRARLAPQYSRLRGVGVPESDLFPAPADRAAANRATAGGPEAVLAALRQARSDAERADSVLIGADVPSRMRAGTSVHRRNLLVYGPFALVVFAVQVALYVAADTAVLPALLCGLAMPAVAYGLGWLTVGLVFPPEPHGRVDRTPTFGAIVSGLPVLLMFLGVLALAVIG